MADASAGPPRAAEDPGGLGLSGRLSAGLAQAHMDPQAGQAPLRRVRRQASKLILTWIGAEDEQQSVRLCDAIDAVGAGVFHVELGIWVGGFLFAEAAELGKASALSHALIEAADMAQSDGDRKTLHAALISVVFVGFAIGNLISGPLGDRHGRRCCLITGYTGMLVCSVLLCAAPVAPVVWACRLLGGLATGLGIPACFAMLAEWTPGATRPLVFCLANLMLSLGVLWVGAWLIVFMPDLKTGNWIPLLIMTDWLPAAFLLFGTYCYVPESPLFLTLAGRGQEACAALAVAARRNGHGDQLPVAEDARIDAAMPETLPACTALSVILGPRLKHTLACSYLELSQMMTAFGMAFAVQEALSQLGASDQAPADEHGSAMPSLSFLLVESVNIPATALSAGLASWPLGHLQVLAGSAAVALVGCSLAATLPVAFGLGMAGAMLAKLVLLPWGTTQKVVISESYPTQLRATALSLTGTVGRVGIIVSPIIADGLGFVAFALVCAAASLLNGLVARTRNETKGCALDDIDEFAAPPSSIELGAAVEVLVQLAAGGAARDRQGIVRGFVTAADGTEHCTVLLRGGDEVTVEPSCCRLLDGAQAMQLHSVVGRERVLVPRSGCDV
eukprot:TRINITY_DN31262_c0_g1_i2.p1 TRINITY_DN31262_c0_g1~~TRINITY_DN31262_c0_g1_i2.p1  ORF type:complete len:619 (+),score=115.63 TRINITY_DN31262_c0_g1_i2:77-1933(+)